MKTNFRKLLVKILHYPTAGILFSIGVLLLGLIFKNFYFLVIDAFAGSLNSHTVVEEVFLIFLQIEIVAAIKIYFAANFHFPLRFLLYVSITDLIRHLIIRRDEPVTAIFFAGAIAIIIGALSLWEFKNAKLSNGEHDGNPEL